MFVNLNLCDQCLSNRKPLNILHGDCLALFSDKMSLRLVRDFHTLGLTKCDQISQMQLLDHNYKTKIQNFSEFLNQP